jgi:hypothetical protein
MSLYPWAASMLAWLLRKSWSSGCLLPSHVASTVIFLFCNRVAGLSMMLYLYVCYYYRIAVYHPCPFSSRRRRRRNSGPCHL